MWNLDLGRWTLDSCEKSVSSFMYFASSSLLISRAPYLPPRRFLEHFWRGHMRKMTRHASRLEVLVDVMRRDENCALTVLRHVWVELDVGVIVLILSYNRFNYDTDYSIRHLFHHSQQHPNSIAKWPDATNKCYDQQFL
ncbi:unnamed protein product [Albugo candida]|uniref:Uncharacterized protein n=1 Tax=Albugo candida TaxID=65357 RepID=A0A024GSV2_9STRA|nr:unnamed protein product [Albugo candida]|eukprot:CCI49993.1 unnamed protein product [Albugo candida]